MDDTVQLQQEIDNAELTSGVVSLNSEDLEVSGTINIDINKVSIIGLNTMINAENIGAEPLFNITSSAGTLVNTRRNYNRFIKQLNVVGPGGDSPSDFMKLVPGTGNNGPSRCKFSDLEVTGFRDMIVPGSNVYLNRWVDCAFSDFTAGFHSVRELDGVPVTNTGERFIFDKCLFGGNKGVGTAFLIEDSPELFITNTSLDTLGMLFDVYPPEKGAPKIRVGMGCHLEAVNDYGWGTTPIVLHDTGLSKCLLAISDSAFIKGGKNTAVVGYLIENHTKHGLVVLRDNRVACPRITEDHMLGGSGDFVVSGSYHATDKLSPALSTWGPAVNKVRHGVYEGTRTVTVDATPGEGICFEFMARTTNRLIVCEYGWGNFTEREAQGTVNIGNRNYARKIVNQLQNRCPSWANEFYLEFTEPPGSDLHLNNLIIN